MSKAKVELHYSGFDEYRNSNEVTDLITNITKKTAERVGVKNPDISHKKTRVVGTVTVPKWNRDKLTKALYQDGGRE